MPSKWIAKPDQIREELVKVTAEIPQALVVSLIDIGQSSRVIYSKQEHYDEDMIAALIAMASSAANRICSDAFLGHWDHSILACEEGLLFYADLGNELNIFSLIVQPTISADELLTAVQPHCQRLWQLIREP